ncbi:hypothetical protein LCGC14_2935400, partial [marine sediment metagenome]
AKDRAPFKSGVGKREEQVVNSQGRFPANLLVSDDVLNDGKISKNARPNCFGKEYNLKSPLYMNDRDDKIYSALNDSGSFSRYFDLDRWWTEQIKKLPKSVQKTFPFLIIPKASKAEKNKGCEKLEVKYGTAIHNRRCKNCGHGELDGRRTGDCCDNPDYINGTVRKEHKNNHHLLYDVFYYYLDA